MKKNNSIAGFTLIELLASIVVIVAVGIVLATIILSTLRGATKTTNMAQVKQNGYFVIMQMTKMLRNAQRLDSPYPCIDPPAPTPLPQYSAVTFTSPDGGQTTFTCDLTPVPPNNSTITSNSASLLDTNVVALESCYFTCSQSVGTELPIIGIYYSLQQAAATTFVEHTASATAIPFQTIVTLRNVNR